MDPGNDPPLEFDVFLPLPMRVCLLITLGIWGFGANLQCLESSGVDTDTLFQFFRSDNNGGGAGKRYYKPVYHLAAISSGVLFGCWWIYRVTLDHDNLNGVLPTLVLLFPLITVVNMILLGPVLSQYIGGSPNRRRIFAVLIPSWSTCSDQGRVYTARVFCRILGGNIDLVHRGARFIDILAADVLTSFSKVLAEFYAIGCIVCTSTDSANLVNHPTRRQCGYGNYVIPVIVAIPYLIRFRQCISDYNHHHGKQIQPLMNALKYASSFPVIFLPLILPPSWSGLWLFSVFVNSLYSFYWDISMDWGLFPRKSSQMRKLHFTSYPFLYYVAIVADLVLRFVWSIRLSPRLYRLAQYEMGIFLLQLCELFRRWVWVFFRAENEYIQLNLHDSLELTTTNDNNDNNGNNPLNDPTRPAFKGL